ncbi:hypothetical protein OJAV_G00052890 [Oryzias javanicus]|uniref:Transmembrane protein 168b n=1 Tax=Oryzias javanicus TaxID=123683 RepID=A0A437D937_ORYJA|nr:hypothetical protein OJAV_G00052890 [Oryzias javanicus]
MYRFLRYCTSHCLHAAVTRLEEVKGEVSMWLSVRLLGYLSGLIVLCFGLYSRWEATSESIFLVILVLGVFVLVTAGVLNFFFDLERVSLGLLHLWYGFLLGLLSFANSPTLKFTYKEKFTNYLLLVSVVPRYVWALVVRLLGRTRYRPVFLTSAERMELAGFVAASTLMPLRDSASVAALVAALAAVMVAIRMNVYAVMVDVAGFLIISADIVLKNLDISPNPFALICFFGHLICDPLLDLKFCGLSVTERWRSFLLRGGLWRRLCLLPLLGLEVLFISLAGQTITNHPQWYILLPFFLIFLLFWAVCHVLFVITLWSFHSKLGDCQPLFHYQETSLDKIMASKGLRLFCLISGRLAFFTLVSSFAIAALCLESSTLLAGVFILIFTLESLFHGLFYELGNTLGGTCVGYAVVIPTNICSPDGQPILLPPGQVQELNKRSTGMLNNVQRFFAHQLIENYGCDYSTSGMTLETLQAKIQNFLELSTQDGPRHDTYMIFYSGHTHRSGEWALAGGDTLPLHQILDWWREKNGGCSSRLVLVLDCYDSLAWVKEVQQDPPQLGDFTAQWVEYNCNPSSSIQWSERGRPISAAYGISKHWSDYTLHLPTGSDLTNHWSGYFPRFSHPVVHLALWCGSRDPQWMCNFCLKCLKRWKLNWFPPTVLDTGQGFKLVRS